MTVTYLSLFCCSNHGGNSTSAEPKPTLWTVFKRRGIRYFFLSVVDVEANYLIHRAFHYTTLTSVQVSGFKLGTNYINGSETSKPCRVVQCYGLSNVSTFAKL